MKRKDFLKALAILPLSGAAMINYKSFQQLHSELLPQAKEEEDPMPVLFVGHGSPTNAIDDSEFSREWLRLAQSIRKPKAILCISAHWETKGTFVTAMPKPPVIYDFGGFSPELYQQKYPAPGSPELAESIAKDIKKTVVELDQRWGLDHGAWVPLLRMYPDADIPVLQLSIDYTQGAEYHYQLAKELASLRRKGVLIIGSGNMVHNLRMIKIESWADINKEYGFDWALEMNEIFKQKISSGDHAALINYATLHPAAKLAIPSTDHYFPLLYTLALQEKDEKISFFNDKAVAGSLTMTSVQIGG